MIDATAAPAHCKAKVQQQLVHQGCTWGNLFVAMEVKLLLCMALCGREGEAAVANDLAGVCASQCTMCVSLLASCTAKLTVLQRYFARVVM